MPMMLWGRTRSSLPGSPKHSGDPIRRAHAGDGPGLEVKGHLVADEDDSGADEDDSGDPIRRAHAGDGPGLKVKGHLVADEDDSGDPIRRAHAGDVPGLEVEGRNAKLHLVPAKIAGAHAGDDPSLEVKDRNAELHVGPTDGVDEEEDGDPLRRLPSGKTDLTVLFVFTGFLMVLFLVILLAALLLPEMCHAGTTKPLLQQYVSIVRTVSVLLCSYFIWWICTFSHTVDAVDIFFRCSYGTMLVYIAHNLIGPVAGMAVAHLGTACAAGLLGYAFAEYRMRTGSERAAVDAAARTPASQSEGQKSAVFSCTFLASLTTIILASRMIWMMLSPSYSDEHTHIFIFELSCIVWWIFYLWTIIIIRWLLHEALVSVHFIMRLIWYHLGSFLLSIVFVVVSYSLWMYCFGLEMMAMTGFFGYALAINAGRKKILARNIDVAVRKNSVAGAEQKDVNPPETIAGSSKTIHCDEEGSSIKKGVDSLDEPSEEGSRARSGGGA